MSLCEADFPPLLYLFQLLVEVTVYLRKARTTMDGVLMAVSLYPTAPCVMVLSGVLKGVYVCLHLHV